MTTNPDTWDTEDFRYDSLDRLVKATATGSPTYDESYRYDAIGNITSKGGVSYSYQTGGSAKPHAVTQVGSTNYTYDANGNMNIGTARTWDGNNMLTSLTKDSVTTDFVYDGDGNRVKKIVRGSPDAVTTYVNKYYEKTGSDVTTYYYLGGKMVAKRTGTTLNYIHQDSLGSTSLLTKTDGTQEGTTMKFTPFGTARSGSVPTNLLFTGQERDIATPGSEIYFYNARYYDPQIGRFISPDTIIPNPKNPQSLNRYTYALNNPLRYIDPTGHDEEEDWYTYLHIIGGGAPPPPPGGEGNRAGATGGVYVTAPNGTSIASFDYRITAYRNLAQNEIEAPKASTRWSLLMVLYSLLAPTRKVSLDATDVHGVVTATQTDAGLTELSVTVIFDSEEFGISSIVLKGKQPRSGGESLDTRGTWSRSDGTVTRQIEMKDYGKQVFSGYVIMPNNFTALYIDMNFAYSSRQESWTDPRGVGVDIRKQSVVKR